MDMGLSRLWELVMDREAWRASLMGSQRVGHNWAIEQQHESLVLLINIGLNQEFEGN